jgi:hypothetical protein
LRPLGSALKVPKGLTRFRTGHSFFGWGKRAGSATRRRGPASARPICRARYQGSATRVAVEDAREAACSIRRKRYVLGGGSECADAGSAVPPSIRQRSTAFRMPAVDCRKSELARTEQHRCNVLLPGDMDRAVGLQGICRGLRDDVLASTLTPHSLADNAASMRKAMPSQVESDAFRRSRHAAAGRAPHGASKRDRRGRRIHHCERYVDVARPKILQYALTLMST